MVVGTTLVTVCVTVQVVIVEMVVTHGSSAKSADRSKIQPLCMGNILKTRDAPVMKLWKRCDAVKVCVVNTIVSEGVAAASDTASSRFSCGCGKRRTR